MRARSLSERAERLLAAPPTRRQVARAAADAIAGLPSWQADLTTVRGRCTARAGRGRCPSRYALIRQTIDLRSAREVARYTTLECARCGHVWRRVNDARCRQGPSTGQRCVITLILPGGDRERWYARGRWHAAGTDGIEVRNATRAQLDDAARDWRERNARYLTTQARATERRQAAADAVRERFATFLESKAEEWQARDAELAAMRAG